jgi:hypothetical protein
MEPVLESTSKLSPTAQSLKSLLAQTESEWFYHNHSIGSFHSIKGLALSLSPQINGAEPKTCVGGMTYDTILYYVIMTFYAEQPYAIQSCTCVGTNYPFAEPRSSPTPSLTHTLRCRGITKLAHCTPSNQIALSSIKHAGPYQTALS